MPARYPLLALAVAAVVGCEPATPPDAEPAAPATPPEAVGPVDLTAVTFPEFERALAAHKGKVVLVDVWFLGCGPCRKKFPQFVAWHHKYKADGLAAVTLDILPDERGRKGEVVEFLKKHGADNPNYIVAGDGTGFDPWLSRHGAEATPALVLFDRRGNHVPLPAGATGDAVEAAVRKALRG